MDTHRYIARIILEAKTPLFVGSGQHSLLKDALVQIDHLGLPMIQGSSLTGVLRHSFENTHKSYVGEMFGYQSKEKAKEGKGSRLLVSSAYMMINEEQIAESLDDIDSTVLKAYNNLPSRQHVRINDKGVKVDNGLFDNEVVYQGTRFVFEMELKGAAEDKAHWEALIEIIKSPFFRLGAGTRNGYGNLSVYAIYNRVFNLTEQADFENYMNWDAPFNALTYSAYQKIDEKSESKEAKDYIHYTLELKPDDFFLFGAGYGDEEVDNVSVTEEVAVYKAGTIHFEERSLIPASSIKGALSHRTCFHYNKLKGRFAEVYNDDHPKLKKLVVGSLNHAVHELFGAEADFDKKHEEENRVYKGQRGCVLIDDLLLEKTKDKIFNHVAIDRFTGGAMDGALFSEKVSQIDQSICLDVYVLKQKDDIGDEVLDAFEEALFEIVNGQLPLGGMTTKGHGFFNGTLHKN